MNGVYRPLLAAGALAGLSFPAEAKLQVIADVNGSVSSCVDQGACDLNPAIGIIQVANGTLNGVQINGSIQTSSGTLLTPGPAILNTSSLSIINLTALTKTVTVAVSDTDFIGPVRVFDTAGAGTWQVAIGSSITMNWYDDPENGQGADSATDTPGNLIDTFSHTATSIVDSFSHNGAGTVGDAGPFSMTEQAIFTLTPFGQLVNRGQTEIKLAVPEPSTWAMGLVGFGFLGYAAYRRRHSTTALQA